MQRERKRETHSYLRLRVLLLLLVPVPVLLLLRPPLLLFFLGERVRRPATAAAGALVGGGDGRCARAA